MTEDLQKTPSREDKGLGLSETIVDQVMAAVQAQDAVRLNGLLDQLHSADIADILEQIRFSDRRRLLDLWTGGLDGEVLSELDEGLREEVIDSLAPQELVEAVRDLESDDVVDLLEDMGEPQQEAILDALDDADRVVVEQSLAYPEDSAGRLMQRELVMGPSHWTVGAAIDYLRETTELPDQFYHLILVDAKLKPTGYVTLGRLLAADRDVRLETLVEDSFRSIPVALPQEDVAYLFNQYHLISAPVVDADDRLVGIITIDDAMVVLDEEHEEDMLRLAGVSDGSLSESVWNTTRQRLPWLAVALANSMIVAMTISFFEDSISQLVALAILMPIVAAIGGSAGTQSLTVSVRALATKDLTSSNMLRVIRRETLTGMINGFVLAVVLGTIGWLWFDMPMLGVVVGLALNFTIMVAGFMGVCVPLVMEKMGIDPALASGTFVTTAIDVLGFATFLGLATHWLL